MQTEMCPFGADSGIFVFESACLKGQSNGNSKGSIILVRNDKNLRDWPFE